MRKYWMINLLKSLYYNFRYLPFKQACHLPILVGGNVVVNIAKTGRVKLNTLNVSFGMIRLGIEYEQSVSTARDKTILLISGYLEFSGSANIGKGTQIVVLPKGKLFIGNSFVITGRSSFRVYRYVKIGDDCLFSWDILVMDYDGHRIFNDSGVRINDHTPLVIGNHVWVGCRSSIWDGADIPDNSIIGNNSIIKSKLIEPNSIYVGNGKMIKTAISWER